MNSRNHIMFGAPGDWVYLYAAGLTQTEDSIGFSHAMFVPPPKLLEAAAMGISFANVSNATISEPLRWGSASKQTMRGLFSLEWHLPVVGGASSTCDASVKEGGKIMLGCPGAGGIKAVTFAEYGTPSGSCIISASSFS
jgi:hypothetical protein